jgi:hypothetical protein
MLDVELMLGASLGNRFVYDTDSERYNTVSSYSRDRKSCKSTIEEEIVVKKTIEEEIANSFC